MAKIVIGLLMLAIIALLILFFLIISLSIALFVFSRKSEKAQELPARREPP
jgi:flagellar basal body-associated protein FliL